MPHLPNNPQPGKPIKADWGYRLLEYLRNFPLRSGPGIQINRTPSGLTISAIKPKTGIRSHPFEVTISNAPERKITLTPGAVNNTVPIIGLDSMYVAPQPVLTLPDVANVGIYLKVTVDAAMVMTATEIVAEELGTVSSDLDETGGDGYELIASVQIDDDGAIESVQQYVKTKLYYRAYLNHIFWT